MQTNSTKNRSFQSTSRIAISVVDAIIDGRMPATEQQREIIAGYITEKITTAKLFKNDTRRALELFKALFDTGVVFTKMPPSSAVKPGVVKAKRSILGGAK